MIEHELTALADRVAPPPADDLAERVLARLDERPHRGRRRMAAVAAGVVVAGSFVSPQVRAFAADVLGVAGIDFSDEAPDAPPEPRAPLPDRRPTELEEARAAVAFPVRAPARLGTPEEVVVSDDGRVVTMTWRDGRVVLDQFDGRPGPVFGKDVGSIPLEPVRVGTAHGWWIGAPHDLTYVDRTGRTLTATARLAGPSLVWESAGVTLRLEGERLPRDRAVAIGGSVR